MATPSPSGRIIGCVGPKGSGKTFLALHMTRTAKRVIRYDLNRQGDMEAGARVAETRADLVEALLAADGRRKLLICWRGAEHDPDGFEWANRAAKTLGGCAVLWDEAETLMRGRHVPPHADDIIRRGRHMKVDCVWTSQRPTNVIPDLRNNSDEIHVFKGFDPTYRNWVKDAAGAEWLERLENAPKYTPLILSKDAAPRMGKKI